MEDSTPIDRNNHQSIDRSVNSYGNDGNSIRSYNWSTNNNSSINDTNSVNKVDDNRLSEELRGLLDHQKEIKKWLSLVEAKIFKAETRYLEDTPLGN